MKALEEKIVKDGRVLPGEILKVNSFLNHQLDISFLNEIGKEFYDLFKDEGIDKIVTIETSGVAIAVCTAQYFKVPVVFAKKNVSRNISDNCYSSRVFSYTHQNTYEARIEKQFLKSNENVLIIDDFLANGLALEGLIDICRQAGTVVKGCGIVIEKSFQPGGAAIRKRGIRVESLAKIKSLDFEKGIEFE